MPDNGKREQPEADDFHHDPSRQVRNGTSPRPLSYGVWLDFDLVHAPALERTSLSSSSQTALAPHNHFTLTLLSCSL